MLPPDAPERGMPRKAFPRTPHLPGSKTGPKDRTLDPGQTRRCTEPTAGLRVIVTEKLDGSCVAVWNDAGHLKAIGRDGSLAILSRTPIRRSFARWLDNEADRFAALPVGSWMVGEWLPIAHATRYRLPHGPFVPFAYFADTGVRQDWDTFVELATAARLSPPYVLHDGVGVAVEEIARRLGTNGFHGALDEAEGAVWLVQRQGRPLVSAKWVRASVRQGRYLADHTGQGHVLNRWRGPDDFLRDEFA